MEDSNIMDIIVDTDEFLIEDWESEFPIYNEILDNQNPNPNPDFSRSRLESGFRVLSERPTKQMKASSKKNNVNSSSSSSSPSSPSSSGSPTSQLISFGLPDPNNVAETLNFSNLRNSEQSIAKNGGSRRQPHLLKEHVIAERKRRQKLNERLIALSALLPGLKKADKATVLEDAIKHLKQLQERVKKLEEERIESKSMESVILVKRSHVYVDDDSSSSSTISTTATTTCSDDSSFSSDDISILKQTMPMIEARVSDKDLLIRVHCEKNKSCLIKILSSLETFEHLDVINSFTLPFGNSTLVINILSKVDNNFSRSVEDVVKNIRLALA